MNASTLAKAYGLLENYKRQLKDKGIQKNWDEICKIIDVTAEIRCELRIIEVDVENDTGEKSDV